VLNMYLNYKPRNIKVEKNNGWEIYAKLFKDPSNMWGYNLPITVVNATKDKRTRLKEFEGCFQRWEIFFKVWKTENVIEQLLYFTGENGNKDDAVDSMVHSFGLSWIWFYFDVA
jgi:predicted phage terminase large subunit-like protein